MKCYNCDDVTVTPVKYKSHYLCPRCFNRTRLPTYTLTKLWTGNTLYDPKSGRYFGDAVEVLTRCGFKLYTKKVFANKEANGLYSEIWTFRYFGNVACRLLDTPNTCIYSLDCRAEICRR